ncbi:hypothetical protein JCM33374_g4107 [Metschnikowia sp. JCM 33374]|nr:hypothetical protein JCM33374_g4107 [Metschnikowia sp. JCM 33374]
MLPASDALYLYNLTLRSPSSSLYSIAGQFSGNKKVQELVLSTTTGIDLYRPNNETGKLQKLSNQKAFANIESLSKIRMAGTEKDLLVLTSDSGNLTVAEFNSDTCRFVPLLQEPHSKSALRRISPGQYLSADPNNRAIMVAAMEKNKLVYKVEMENTRGMLELSSPLEVTSKNFLTLSLCALDTGYENPLWAALEIDHSDYNSKTYNRESSPLMLNLYELDQGLNHIVRRRSKPDVPASANLLVPLPGNVGGVLVCCNSYMIYEKSPGSSSRLLVPLPVRAGSSGTKIVCHFLHKLKKQDFFILLQSSLGDLYKVTVSDASERHPNIKVTYFDSIPICNSIDIFKSGFLFANTTSNNKLFYQFEQLGSDNETTVQSRLWNEELQVEYENTAMSNNIFKPVGLQNLALVDIVESLGPLMDSALVETTTTGTADPLKQLVTLSSHSYMKSLMYGMTVSELVSSPLPMNPTTIYTTKILKSSKDDQYLVLSSSLSEKTIILSIGEVVEEVMDSGFVNDQYTLAVQQIGVSSVAQIHRNGIRNIKHVVDENSGEIVKKINTDWYPPAGITVLHATSNNEQIVVGLSNREVCYFEIDPADDQLSEYQQRFEVSGGSITALAINSNPLGERKSFFLIVGSSDETIQVLSLSTHTCFDVLTLQALSSNARSLLMLSSDRNSLHVHIGMESGVYVRVSIDSITGKLSDTRLKYLGTKPVQLRELRLPDVKQSGILAISSRPWVGYFNIDKNFKLYPLLGTNITSGTSFFSDDIGTESVVGISGTNLTIFTLGNEESGFNVNDEFVVNSTKLRYTPKKQVQEGDFFFVLESEYNIASPYATSEQVDEDYYEAFGFERKEESWASCIQVVKQTSAEVTQTFEFENNECAVALCLLQADEEKFLVVSTAQDLNFGKQKTSVSFLYTFTIESEHKLKLLHKTSLDGHASALEFLGDKKLLAAVGNQLRVYELGKKQFLRKASTKVEFLRRVNKVKHVGGDIVVVGDSQSSLIFFQYDSVKNNFTPFVNDSISRQITTFENLDSRTVIGGDKFGNIFVNRIPQPVFEQLKDNVLMKFQEEFLNGSASRSAKLCDFYIQDIPTSFQKGTFVVGGTESIIYTGLQGTVGLLIPLATKHEVDFMLKLENIMRKSLDEDFSELSKEKRAISLAGREHIKFRSYYNPVKNVVDGDFIEKYYELDQASKIKIAGQLDRAPREIERKLYDLRNRAAF